MSRTVAFMLSNDPEQAMGSLRHYTAFDDLYIYHHEDQKADFDAAYQEKASNIRRPDGSVFPVSFLYHNISNDRGAPLGAIRFHLFNESQRIIGRRDKAVMVDDDLKAPRYVRPSWFKKSDGSIKWILKAGRKRYPAASSKIFREYLDQVGDMARSNGFQFFTGNHNGRPKNGYNPREPFKATWHCNMLWGYFKNSFNPFDPKILLAEDYAADCKLLDKFETLTILSHRGLVPEYEILGEKYGVSSLRNKTVTELSKSHPYVYLARNFAVNQGKTKKKFAAPRIAQAFKNSLKKTIAKQFR
jgi:hypothetical protein